MLFRSSTGSRAAWLKTKGTPPHAHGAKLPLSLRATTTPPTRSVMSAPAMKVYAPWAAASSAASITSTAEVASIENVAGDSIVVARR